MIKIEYPAFPFRIKNEGGKEFIFDEIRKLWVRLTPEEWVRQNMLLYLIKVKYFPPSMIAVEREIVLGELVKRFDILVYHNHQPIMLIECKAMSVALSADTANQLLRYQLSVPAKYWIFTNGNNCIGFSHNKEKLIPLNDIPHWESLSNP